jgi:hypothetical protein
MGLCEGEGFIKFPYIHNALGAVKTLRQTRPNCEMNI